MAAAKAGAVARMQKTNTPFASQRNYRTMARASSQEPRNSVLTLSGRFELSIDLFIPIRKPYSLNTTRQTPLGTSRGGFKFIRRCYSVALLY